MGTNRRPHCRRVLRDDMVMVIAGDDKGKTGRVLRVDREKSRLVVEGVNLVHRHIKRSQQNPQGGRVKREAPFHMSNVMVLDSDGETVTKIGKRQIEPEKGSLGWERFARKSGEAIGQVAKSGKAAKSGKSGKAGKKAKKSKE
jgi:large subunit ribosomal protein L24